MHTRRHELLLQQTSPTRNKDRLNPSKTQPDVHQTTSEPSRGAVCPRVFWLGIPQLATKTAEEEKKIPPPYLVKNTSLVAAVGGKMSHIQLKIPGSVGFPPPPACFCSLKTHDQAERPWF